MLRTDCFGGTRLASHVPSSSSIIMIIIIEFNLLDVYEIGSCPVICSQIRLVHLRLPGIAPTSLRNLRCKPELASTYNNHNTDLQRPRTAVQLRDLS